MWLRCSFIYYFVASSKAKIYNKIKSNKKFFICGSSCLRAVSMVCKNSKPFLNAGKLNCFTAVCSSDYKEIPCALPASPAPFFCPQTAPETSDVLPTSVPVRKDMGVLFPRNSFLPYGKADITCQVEFVTWNWLFIFRLKKLQEKLKENLISSQAAHREK